MVDKNEHIDMAAPRLLRREKQLSVLTDLSAVISQAGNLKGALDQTIDQLLALSGAEIGTVHLIEAGGDGLRLAAWRGVSQSFRCAEERIPMGDCLCGEAASSGELLASSDLEADSRISRGACRQEQFGSIVSIPLKSIERIVGILTIYSARKNAFKKKEEDLLQLVGRQIGVAVDNAMLYHRVRRMAVEEERGHIAKEIHDGIAQSLAFLNMESRKLDSLLKNESSEKALPQLNQIRRVIQDTYEDARELLVDFRMKFKEGDGFHETLNDYAEGYQQRTGTRVLLSNGTRGDELSPDSQIQLFRVIQEALSNIRKHARAEEVRLTLSSSPTHFEVAIRDNGCGFDPQEVAGRKQPHMGLEIMKERTGQLKGGLYVNSSPGAGTTLRITVPLSGPSS